MTILNSNIKRPHGIDSTEQLELVRLHLFQNRSAMLSETIEN